MGKNRGRLNKWISQVVEGIEEPFTHADILMHWGRFARPRYKPTSQELVMALRGLMVSGAILEHPEKVRTVYPGLRTGYLIQYVRED